MQERGILCAALGRRAFPTALAEVFQTGRTIDRRARDPAVAFFSTSTSLVLLDLSTAFATRIGASMAIDTGPRSRARRWARRLHGAYPNAHGIHYPSHFCGSGRTPARSRLPRSSASGFPGHAGPVALPEAKTFAGDAR